MSAELIRVGFRTSDRCRICGKGYEAHSWEEAQACREEELAQTAEVPCTVCGRPFEQHSMEDHKACAEKQRHLSGAQ